MRGERSDLGTALLLSGILHAVVLGAALIPWPWDRELKIGSVVPINIVSSIPANPRPAVQGPEEQTAQTEAPEPDAPLEATVAAPEPQPAPQPTPAPQPSPKAPTPKPAPTPAPKPAPTPTPKPAPPKKSDSLDLDALASSLKGSQSSSAARGAARPETARQARSTTGSGISAAAMSGLAEELQRRWNPNCEVEAARNVRVRVTFRLGSDGRVVGDVRAGGQENSSDPVTRAAAERAIRAVYSAAPFTTLPREFYGDQIAVSFNAAQACADN
ncbi:energy transducer TonB [Phenylobacterium sp.]|jgi:outer membrane biosynthesis protein TonB|uniref:energy transducer TonB n=1 Tax=Phenylobacterium sp. TaxID=1871053 RepID=UPI000C909226|nr:energy transducer TonB [Phenylobacterium sp.]MAK82521.1 cell envelope biogenesis protein TolA [Phenylobacterium sp.]|tara:strand:+ start:18002 stop:18817 length:816 start_codon:yes stop_codon:yes gene_type:complete